MALIELARPRAGADMTHKQAGGCSRTITLLITVLLLILCFLSLSFPLFYSGWEGQQHLERMIFSNEDARPVLQKSGERRALRSPGLPSPALCCACGLCIMLAGINITLVGALAFNKLLPLSNPPIIIGPILLLVAFSFFGACCICSRRPIRQASRTSAGRDRWALMRMGRAVFEMETSEPTLQDTTAIQLSPTNSPSSSHRCSPNHLPGAPLHPSETYGFSKGNDVRTHSLGHAMLDQTLQPSELPVWLCKHPQVFNMFHEQTCNRPQTNLTCHQLTGSVRPLE